MQDSALLESFAYFFDPTSISQEFLDVQLHRNIITFPTCSQNVQTQSAPGHWYLCRNVEILWIYACPEGLMASISKFLARCRSK